MKTKIVLTLFAVTFAALVIAQAPPNYTAAEAAKHVGETATVTDKVEWYQSAGGNTFLSMAGKYPNQAFTAFIPASSAAQFARGTYNGHMVAVSGKIVLLRSGKPGIVVNSPSQILVK